MSGRRARRLLRLPAVLASPMAQFAVSGLAAAVVVGVVGTLVIRHQAVKESLRDARNVGRLLATGLRPVLTDGVVTGDPAALVRLDAAVRAQVLHEPVVRVKLWTSGGRIVYSDEKRLVGAIYQLQPDDLAALRTGRVTADLSDLSQPENRFERSYGKLLEVYLPVTTPQGRRLLFEPYLQYTAVDSNRRNVYLAFAPVMIAMLIGLWLVQLPIAWSVTRRLRRGQEEREHLLLRAVDASDAERRRIASDLHDTVVQELLGISYGLSAAAERSTSAPRGELRDAFSAAATGTRESMRSLRSLLFEIYPPSLRATGLGAALDDLVAPLAADGIETEVSADRSLRLDDAAEELVFRTAQEALRNVAAHAQARRVEVSLACTNGTAVLVVGDDGAGFDKETASRRRAEGHLGLELLSDRAGLLDGTLSVTAAPGTGTIVRLELPVR
jgi:two-component system NarL family sensor kinase